MDSCSPFFFGLFFLGIMIHNNGFPSVTELCEYAANVDIPIARESIRAVGKIALQQYDVNAIVDRLLQFLEMDKDYVTAETLASFVNPIMCTLRLHIKQFQRINGIVSDKIPLTFFV